MQLLERDADDLVALHGALTVETVAKASVAGRAADQARVTPSAASSAVLLALQADRAREPSHPDEHEWRGWVQAALNDDALLTLVFQPIVSLADGVIVGYEALSRFTPLPGITPDLWFAAADRQGLGAELEAVVVRRCLAMLPSLPANCFLTVNVSPHLLTEPALAETLLAAGPLAPLVIELTEHQGISDLTTLQDLTARLAGAGALLALDDAGSGYSGLQQMADLRPNLIKMDRALVSDIAQHEAKLALAEMLGEYAGRIDAWLLAEGVETWAELDAFQRLGVPLGQGYLLGRPGPPWVQLEPGLATRLRSGAARVRLVESVASLVESVPAPAGVGPDQVAVRRGADGQPQALLLPRRRGGDGRTHREVRDLLRVPSAMSVLDLARRVVARPDHCRFDPVVCVDDLGRVVGIVRVERVLQRLTELSDH